MISVYLPEDLVSHSRRYVIRKSGLITYGIMIPLLVFGEL